MYNLDGIECSTRTIGERVVTADIGAGVVTADIGLGANEVDARICETCALTLTLSLSLILSLHYLTPNPKHPKPDICATRALPTL